MNTVDVWTGREALLLRSALRLSQRGFAAHLGVSERIVATWDRRRETITPRSEIQAILDTALIKAPAGAQLRFRQALSESSDGQGSASTRLVAEPLLWPAPPNVDAVSTSELSTLTLIDAQQIEMLAVELTAWDHARGGSLARIAAVAQAHWSVELLSLGASVTASASWS